jgi:hypothetical protein
LYNYLFFIRFVAYFKKYDILCRMLEQGRRRSVEKILVPDFPFVTQRHKNWCGYATAESLLQFHGYPVTQIELFSAIHNTSYRPGSEINDPHPGPTLAHLASVLKELTSNPVHDDANPYKSSLVTKLALGAPERSPLRVDYFDRKIYSALQKRRPDITPIDVLHTYLKEGIPCIIRFPGHYHVAVGVDPLNERYLTMNPLMGGKNTHTFYEFREKWGDVESDGFQDTDYLMLALRPKRI